jgi:hypothetical protein
MNYEYKIIKDMAFDVFIYKFIEYLEINSKYFIEIIPVQHELKTDLKLEKDLLKEYCREKTFHDDIVFRLKNFKPIVDKFKNRFITHASKGTIIFVVFTHRDDLLYLYENGFEKTLHKDAIRLEISIKYNHSVSFKEDVILNINKDNNYGCDSGEYFFTNLLELDIEYIDRSEIKEDFKNVNKLIKDIRKF